MNPMDEGLHALREVYDPQPEYPRPARIGRYDGLILRAMFWGPIAFVSAVVLWACA